MDDLQTKDLPYFRLSYHSMNLEKPMGSDVGYRQCARLQSAFNCINPHLQATESSQNI